MKVSYQFTSTRLGFRNWNDSDIQSLIDINADEQVMEFFPTLPAEAETLNFIERMQAQYMEKGFCYFAVDRLDSGQCIGFIGLSEQTFPSDFTPCIDLGWRLQRSAWNQGFATEGALRCIRFAFDDLSIPILYAMAPMINLPSIHVMEKAGMRKVKTFIHPKLTDHESLKHCVLYEISNTQQ